LTTEAALLIQINGSTTILVTICARIMVDDDPGLLKSVARLLAHHGIESRTFARPRPLLESDSVQTACLLFDIHLRGIGNSAATRACGIRIEVARHVHDRKGRRRAMKRWKPGASRNCASRSRSVSC
jgi:hypothetical protein